MISQKDSKHKQLFGILKYEQKIFDMIQSNKNILMIGLPGVGKTALIKNICHELKENKKMYRYYYISDLMFDEQKLEELILQIDSDKSQSIGQYKSCFIIDQIDVLWSQKRFQTIELLQSILYQSSEYIVIALTSRPWLLKDTFVENYEKIYIDIPSLYTKLQILINLLENVPNQLTKQQIQKVCSLTEGFTCSDLITYVKDVSYQPLRNFMKNNPQSLKQLDTSTVQLSKVTYEIFVLKKSSTLPSCSQQDHNRLIQHMK